MRALLRLLRRVREPAIVFTEYRDTADRLRDALMRAGHRVVVLHGGLTAVERRTAIEEFNKGDALLVATDAASEGLNLQHRCRLVVHFELPWTPSRLHQRCGRVSRIGQTLPVHEVALVADDTAERLVIDPLVRRAGRAGHFGVASLTAQLPEARVSERLLGGVPEAATPAVGGRLPLNLVTLDLRHEAVAEAARLELLRRCERRPRPSQGGRPMLPAAHAGRTTTRAGEAVLTLVVTTTIRDRMGGPLEEGTVAVSGRLPGLSWRPDRAAFGRQLPTLLEQIVPGLRRRLSRRTGPRLSEVRAMHDRVSQAIGRRETAIEGSLRSAARELVQAGLFDRRALRTGNQRAARAGLVREHGSIGANDPAGAFAAPGRAVRETRVIAGMSGSLLSHDAVERLIASGAEPELTPDRWLPLQRRLRGWHAELRQRLGPTAGPRTVFDLVASPFASTLGFAVLPVCDAPPAARTETVDAELRCERTRAGRNRGRARGAGRLEPCGVTACTARSRMPSDGRSVSTVSRFVSSTPSARTRAGSFNSIWRQLSSPIEGSPCSAVCSGRKAWLVQRMARRSSG